MSVLDADTLPLEGTQFIEASAGTGKTFTIATLFARLIVERGYDVGEVLVVTYTEAAAAELAGRIRERLRQSKDAAEARRAGRPPASDLPKPVVALLDAAAARPGGLDAAHARLAVALHAFDERAISTIHGFCLRALQEHAFESGSAFDLDLVGTDRELVTDVAWDYWSTVVHHASPVLIDTLRSTRVGRDALGPEVLGALIAKKNADPDVALWMAPEGDPLDEVAEAWWAEWRELAHIWSTSSQEIVDLLRSGAVNRGTYSASRVENKLPDLMDRMDASMHAGLRDADEEKTLSLMCPDALAEKTSKNKTTPEHPFFDAAQVVMELQARFAEAREGALAAVLRGALEHGERALADRKRRAGIQFFDDLLRDLASALHGDRGDVLARRMGEQYPVALIDEFQDTDPIQYGIFERVWIAAGRPIFLVGDPKQAIYGFRGADVFAYLRARRDSVAVPHDLAVNWRSDPGLVDAVNRLFTGAQRPFVFDEIGYQPVTARPDARDLFAKVDGFAPFEILRLEDPHDSDLFAKGQAEKAAARAVSVDVVRLLGAGYEIDGRALRAGDVAVLCRTHRQARRMKRAFREAGIPAVEVGESSVFETPEAEELEWLLKGLVAAHDLRRVRAALGTRLLGLDASALRRLEAEPDTWDDWLVRFARWRSIWLTDGIVAALEAIVETTGAFARMLGEEGGERVVTNFEQLVELLHDAAERARIGPESLVAWLSRQRLDPGSRDHAAREQAKIRLESDAAAVQIVTVHASKGLEYPVVYCPFPFDAARLSGADATWVPFHDGLRDGTRSLDLGSTERATHTEEAGLELLAEHLRLLYVALTRAVHRCVVVWGRLAGQAQQHRSALAYLLHQPEGEVAADAASFVDAVQTHAKGMDAERFDADLARLVARAPDTIALRTVSATSAAARAEAPAPGPALAALQARRVLHARRRTSSFSGLVANRGAGLVANRSSGLESGHADRDAPARGRGAGADSAGGAPSRDVAPLDEGLDHDAWSNDAFAFAEPSPGPGLDARVALADFPAGAMVGTAVHAAFEHLDFARAADAEALRVLREGLERAGVATPHAAAFAAAVPAMLDAPLSAAPGAARLVDVALADRIDELEFIVPAGLDAGAGGGATAITPAALAAVFHRHAANGDVRDYAERLAHLDFLPLEGFLKGFVDLVFRHDGRYHVVDYKSNLLGPHVADYAPERLVAPMIEHDYLLQYHLYVLALHRQLAWRLPGYDYDTHMGDVYYLFLRGLSADHPPGTGVYADRPPRALVEALSELFAVPAAREGAA